MADKNGFLLRIITPDRVFYESQIDMVEFNTTEGEVGLQRSLCSGNVGLGSPAAQALLRALFCRRGALFLAYPDLYEPKREAMLLQDLDYLQQMYPGQVKRFQRRIAEMLDKTDYFTLCCVSCVAKDQLNQLLIQDLF